MWNQDEDADAAQDVIKTAVGKAFNFNISGKMDTFGVRRSLFAYHS